jgi:hypothetical protein
LNSGFADLLEQLQIADVAPTMPTVAAAAGLQNVLADLTRRWVDLKTKDVSAINAQLLQANLPALVP